MTESALIGWSNNNAAYAAANSLYVTYGGALPSAGTAEGFAQEKFRGSGTFQNARVYIAANTFNQACSAKSRISGANGASAISITIATTGTFSDTTHTDSLADGNLWDSTFIIAGAGSMNIGSYTAELVFPSQSYQLMGAYNASTGTMNVSSSVFYQSFAGQSPGAGASTIEAEVENFALEAATMSLMQVRVTLNGNTNTVTFRSRKNGVDGTQTIALTAGTISLVEDTTHSDSLVAADKFCMSTTTGAGTTSMRVMATGMKLLGSSGGSSHAELFASGAFANGATYYNVLHGKLNNQSTEANANSPFPFAGSVSKLACSFSANASAAGATLILRKGGVDQTNTVAVTASTTGLFRDTTHRDTFAAGDLITTKYSGQTGAQTPASFGALINGPVTYYGPYRRNQFYLEI